MKHGLRRRWVGVLLGGLLPAVSALALPSHGARVTTVDGLPSNVVHQIVEDRQGYLWFATGDGLARYDGGGFRVWRMEHGLADNEVRSMALDARDQLWIGTANGYLQRLSVDRQRFERWAGPPASAAAPSPVLAIQPMDAGDVWFGTRDAGLFRLGRDRRLRQYLPGAGGGLPSARVDHLAADPQGGVWIGSAAGLARWHDDRFQTPAMLGASLLPVTALGRDAQGAMRSSTADGTEVRYLPALQPAPRPREPARWLGSSRAGGDWFADGAQLWWQDRHGLDRHAITLPHLHGRSMPRIVRVVEDRQGRVWLLGSHQGVWRLGAQWRHLERFRAPGDPPAAASGGLAAATDGQAWWARGGWLGKVSPVHGFSRARWSYTQDPLRPDRHAVVEDAQGRVWVFAAPWLTRIDPPRGLRRRWRVGADDAGSSVSTQTALLACDGRIWLAGNGRLQQRADDGRVLVERTYDAARLRPGGTAFVLQCDPAGQLWLGDSEGLKQWQPAHARFDPVPGGPRRAVGALHLAADGQLWAGDPDGWTVYRRASVGLQGAIRVDAAQGLPAAVPRGLADADDGAMWATTARGVVRLAPDRRSARLYTVDDGLPPMVFDLGMLAVGGHLLAMDLAGDVLALDPAGMIATTVAPLLVIDRVQVRRQRRWIELPAGDPLRLNADDRDIQLSARLLSGGQRGMTDYRFRLRGQDPAWVRAGRRGTRGFPSLPAGAHVLEFQARGVGGQWTPLQQVRLQVDHNGWAHPGAWALFWLVATGSAVLLAAAVRRHQKRANARRAAARRQARAERAAQAKQQYLATLGHEVRTPLTGVLGMSELLLSGPLSGHAREQVLHIEQGGRALLQVVDEALETARLQAGKICLQPRRFAIGPWRMDMEATLAACLELHGCRLSLGPPLPAGACRVGDPDRLRQAVHLLARGLALQVGASRVTLCMAWLPGGTGLLLDVIAVPGALPSPALAAVREMLADVDVLAAAMQGGLRVLQLPDHRWQAVLSVPLAGCAVRMPEPEPVVVEHDGLQVLLVEDDPLVAEVVIGLLRMRGHAVVAAGHALAALTALARPGTQLMLLDLDLPGMDGLSLLRLVRQRDHRLPVLVLTARREPDLEATVAAAGADGLLHKPLQGGALHAAIQRIMARDVDRAGPGNGLLCGALPGDRGGRG